MTLTEFLLARIADDEAVARDEDDWESAHRRSCLMNAPDHTFSGMPYCDCAHPARVLAECEAKRRIVAHLDAIEGVNPPPVDLHVRSAFLALALPYSDHPDYRDEWRP